MRGYWNRLAMSYLLVSISTLLGYIAAGAAAAALVLGRIHAVFVVHQTIFWMGRHWCSTTAKHRIRIARQRTTVMSDCRVIMMCSRRIRTNLIVARVLVRYRFRFTVSIG